jgi:hypothetical protein
MDWSKYASTCNTVVATIGIVAGGVWGIIQYKNQQVAQLKAQRYEAARPFLQRQLDLCVDASDAAATLASTGNAKQVAAARDRFWQLYIGSLHIVEDFGSGSVADRMYAFGRALKQVPADANELAAMDIEKRGLEGGALDIGMACRALIVTGWKDIVPQLGK